MIEKIDARIDQLRPRIKSFSHYIQLLVDHDLKGSCECDKKPFNVPDLHLGGVTIQA